MKISVEKSIQRFENMNYKSSNVSKGVHSSQTGMNLDQLIIGSSSSQIEEKKFVGEMSSQVMLSVRSATSQDKINMIKQQVQDGTYRTDAEMIASRILLEKGTL